MAEHIVAVFQTNEEASAAVAGLEAAGIPASAIRQYASNGSAQQEVEPTTHTSAHTSGGFWSWLFGDESETTRSTYAADADAYDRRTAAGNVAVSVTVADDSKIHQAIAALEAHHPIDIDESADEIEGRETTGTVPPTAHSAAGNEFLSGDVDRGDSLPAGEPAGVGAGRVGTAHTTTSPVPPASTALPPSGTAGVASGREEVIPLAEEQLEVDKRTVDRGTTRIRRYVGPLTPYGDPHGVLAETKAGLDQAVRERAYLLWEQAGRPDDRTDEFWHQAQYQRFCERAYALWEREGFPEGRADEHWHRTRAFEES